MTLLEIAITIPGLTLAGLLLYLLLAEGPQPEGPMHERDFTPRDRPDAPPFCAICGTEIYPGDLIGLTDWLCCVCNRPLGVVVYSDAVASDPDPRARIQARVDLLRARGRGADAA